MMKPTDGDDNLWITMSDEHDRMEGDDYPVNEAGDYKIGAVLERARMERGLTLQEVENATKIRKRYLDGLEREDYGVLPDVIYAQGFLKTYANFLGLDGDELSAEFKRRRGRRREQRTGRKADQRAIRRNSSERDFINPGGVSGARRKLITPATLLTIILAIVALAIVIGVLYYVGRDTLALENEGAPISASPSTGSNNEQAAAPNDAENRPAQATSIPADSVASSDFTVSLTSTGSTWLSVETDGSTDIARVVDDGFERDFEAQRRISINTGNAGDILVRVNGQDLGPLGSDGEVVAQDFTFKDAS